MQDKKMLLSFILPCYNVSKYIHHCIDSILSIDSNNCGKIGDTSYEYEVLCVVDPSTDNTVEILNDYASRHANIHVLATKTRLGIGQSRNYGLKHASGEYIWFVDSDDSICSDAAIGLSAIVSKENIDVLAFNYQDLNDDGSLFKLNTLFLDTEIMNGVDFVKRAFGDTLALHLGFIWRFLYKREYLIKNDIMFPEGNWEDTVYMPKAMIMADRIQSSSLVGYEYWHHQSSICRTMAKKYPGKLLYEFSVNAGTELFDYANGLKDDFLRDILRRAAIDDYFNYFPPYLCRAGWHERRVFYRYVRANYKEKIKPIRKYMHILPKLLVHPLIGSAIAEVVSILYYIKHIDK